MKDRRYITRLDPGKKKGGGGGGGVEASSSCLYISGTDLSAAAKAGKKVPSKLRSWVSSCVIGLYQRTRSLANSF